MRKRVIGWVLVAIVSVSLCAVLGFLVKGNQTPHKQDLERQKQLVIIPEESGLTNLIKYNFSDIKQIKINQSTKPNANVYQLRTTITKVDDVEEEHDFTIKCTDKSYEIIDEQKTLTEGFSPNAEIIYRN